MTPASKIRFDCYEADLEAGELRKNGQKVKLSGQPFLVLATLIERPGQIVTREELQKRLWPDTFVDVDHNLNTAINKIREVLGDSSTNARFVETLPRRGYRFIAPVNGSAPLLPESTQQVSARPARNRFSTWAYVAMVVVALSIMAAYAFRRAAPSQKAAGQPTLTRVTFAKGLQVGATWSPDSRFIAYASNQAGKFDIWVQQLSGGDPVQVTHQPGDNWQPDWSPDGNLLVYRSEQGDGGLFVVPAMGGHGQERKISSVGYYPQWSPDGSRILFQGTQFSSANSFYVVRLDGEPPQLVLPDFFAKNVLDVISAAWYPDGKRISVSVWNGTPIPEFWTIAIENAARVKTELDPTVIAQLTEVSANYPIGVELLDFKFRWAPLGDAIYFERTFRGVKNIWKMNIDRGTLRGVGIERLTTGAGADTELALSPDGQKVAFSTEAVHVGVWLFPFSATSGRVTGTGIPIATPGSATWGHALTRDDSKIALLTERAGRMELWEKSLGHRDEAPILVDDQAPRSPAWSPDGKQLAYFCQKSGAANSEIDVWSSNDRSKDLLSPPSTVWRLPVDWSPDGGALLVAQPMQYDNHWQIWSVPASRVSGGQSAERRVAADPAYDLWQPHFSPDGRWIVFEAVARATDQSALYVLPTEGGRWTPIPTIGHWDDKPRWSPDGKIIYYVSERHGFFNVWGIHFDQHGGVPIGKPFPVTKFESPNLMVPTYIPPVELSITENHLALNLAEVSGSIWMLEPVK